jgi:ribosomal protein S18 acetylase RimI-like enzyme
MPSAHHVCSVEPLGEDDIVAAAQCIAIDADTFPYASARFGLRSASTCVWVAREPGRRVVIGFAATRARTGVMHIDGLAVDAIHRRRGIGRALLREVIETALSRRIHRVALHVSVANRAAIALYTSEGFVVRGRLRRFYPPSPFAEETDAYAMDLCLSATPR